MTPKNDRSNHSVKTSAASPSPKILCGHDARHATNREARSHTAIDKNPMATMHDWRGFSVAVNGNIARSVLPPERNLLASSADATDELLELTHTDSMVPDDSTHAWRVGDAALVLRCQRWEPACVYEIEAPGPGTNAMDVRLCMRLIGRGHVADLWIGFNEWRTQLRPLTTLVPDGGRLNTGHFCKAGDLVVMDCFDLCESDFWVPPQQPVALVRKAMAQVDSAVVELTTLVATETVTVPNSLTRRLDAESYNGLVSKVAAVRAETVRLIDAMLAGASATVPSLPASGEDEEEVDGDLACRPLVHSPSPVRKVEEGKDVDNESTSSSPTGGVSTISALINRTNLSSSITASSMAPEQTEVVSKNLEGKLMWHGIIKVCVCRGLCLRPALTLHPSCCCTDIGSAGLCVREEARWHSYGESTRERGRGGRGERGGGGAGRHVEGLIRYRVIRVIAVHLNVFLFLAPQPNTSTPPTARRNVRWLN